MKQQLVKPYAMKNTTLLIEIIFCTILILLMSISSTIHIPISIPEIYRYTLYLSKLSLYRFNTHSVFLVGNLIIILIFIQSTNFFEKPTHTHKLNFDQNPKATNFSSETIQLGIDTNRSVSEQSIVVKEKSVEAGDVNVREESGQVYRRTYSASYERNGKVDVRVVGLGLRRSKTVKGCGGNGKGRRGDLMVAGRIEELNHDEFRRKIESFIDKQRKLIREELVV